PQGRLTSATQGTGPDARISTFAYDTGGRLKKITDPIGRMTQFLYDAAGRLTTQTLPDGNQIQYAYDAKGNLASVRPPGRPAHLFAHPPVDLVGEYTPPDVGAGTNHTVYTHNADRDLTLVTRPDGKTVGFEYGTTGKLRTTTIGRGEYGYEYSATTGQL